MLRTRALLSLAGLFCSLLFAQSDRATITGRVNDATGAAIGQAAVAATNIATGVIYKSTSNEAGNYTIPQLPVGRYEIAVSATGFKRAVRKDVPLDVAQTLTNDVVLEVGQVEQSVEVSANAAVVETTTSELGTVVDSRRVIDLPLAVSGNMRNPESFIFLTPGVPPPAVGSSTDNVQINGSQSRAKEVLLDGISAVSPESGGILFTSPTVEAISEFKLVGSNFSAQYGRTGGGVEVFTTKSGTNTLHGSVFDYFRNDALDARGFFARTTPVNRQNEFGAALGGPVVLPKLYNGRNKSFFYVVYSGFRFRAGATNSLRSIPPADFRAGDFSRLLTGRQLGNDALGRPVLEGQIFDPASTRTVNGQVVRDPFPGNVIPASRFSSVSRGVLSTLPTPTNNALINNFLSVGRQQFDRDQGTAKFDHSFNERHRIGVFAYINAQTDIGAEILPTPLSAALSTDRKSRWIRFTDDYVFSPTALNSFTYGFTREGQYWAKLSAGQDWPQKLGLTGVSTGPENSFPRITFTNGYTNLADEVKNVGAQVNNAFQFTDALSLTKGKHNLRFGGEGRWLQTNGADPNLSQGSFAFSFLETSSGVAATRTATGNALASFLLGTVDNATENLLLVVPGNRYRYFALFAQDDWKISRKLTLNLGLRWDLFLPRTEAFNNLSSFDPTLANPAAGGRLGAISFLGTGPGRNGRTSFADTDYKSFGPRVGFAYALTDKTVLRGGYGIFYAPGNATAGLRSSQSFSLGYNASPAFQSGDAGVTPAFNWDQGFPQNYPRPPFIDPAVGNNTNVNAILGSDGRPPYFQNFTFTVQRELPGSVLLETSYVGVKGTRLGTGLINYNEVDPRYLSLGGVLTQSVTSAAAQQAGIALPYPGFTGTVAQALRPYPQFLAIAGRSNPNGNSTYHALQVKGEKRLSRGLTVLAAYTWSKTISDGDIQAGGGPSGQTYYNRRLEKAVSTNDVPHILALSYLYDLPFGKGQRFANRGGLLTTLAGGWTFTAIQQYASGRPIAIQANNGLPLFNGQLRPNVVAGVPKQNEYSKFDPATTLYINPAAFTSPGPFTLGNAARAYTDLRTFGFANESFGLIKRTNLTERLLLTFRAEAFNAFNRTVFAAPASNINNADFGRVSSQANTPRQGQLALRLDF